MQPSGHFLALLRAVLLAGGLPSSSASFLSMPLIRFSSTVLCFCRLFFNALFSPEVISFTRMNFSLSRKPIATPSNPRDLSNSHKSDLQNMLLLRRGQVSL